MAYEYHARRGTTAEYAALNRIYADGEILIERGVDSVVRIKIGDGVTAYNSLPYATDSGVAASTFGTVSVSGQGSIIADTGGDTLTVASNPGITLATNTSTDTLTISPAYGTTSGTICQGNDSRLPSTAPASLVHATQHKSGGSDPIKLDELSAPTDVTTLNASTASHGLLRKLDNNALHFLDGTHSWSVPTAVLNVARPWEVVVTPVVGDNGVAINTAIDYVFDTYGGGSIILLPQIYTVSTTILRRSNVLIKGAFKASWVFEGAPTKGTVIKWTGASLGTVFKDNPNSPEYRVDGGGISDLTIDGNSLAAYGLEAWNVMSPVYERIHCARIVTSGVAFYWNAHLNGQGVGWESCYHLRINDLSANLSGGATGFWLNGSAASGNNIVFASFRNCHVTFENGTAYRIDYGDDNRFNDCAASKISGGTGYAIWLGAGAYGNGFNGFNSNADIRSISGAMGNYVFNTAVDHAMILTEDVLGSCIVTSYDGVSINSHKSYNNSLEMDTYGWVKRITTTGNMTFNGDNGDFMYYDRTANIWSFYIGNTRAGYIASDGWHNG